MSKSVVVRGSDLIAKSQLLKARLEFYHRKQFFNKQFNDIFKYIGYLDIFRFLRIYLDLEGYDSNHLRKFVISEWSAV